MVIAILDAFITQSLEQLKGFSNVILHTNYGLNMSVECPHVIAIIFYYRITAQVLIPSS